MPQTLKEIVNAALMQADASIKVASLREAPLEDRSLAKVDAYLAHELGQVELEPAATQTKVAGQAEASDAARTSQYDDVRFALKLAEALEHGAHVVEKLALEGPLNKSTGGAPKPGPAPAAGPAKVLKQPFENAKVVQPAPQASAQARRDALGKGILVDGHPPTDEGRMLNEGPVIPRNYPNGRNITNGKNSKHASHAEMERLLRSKIAQHRMLVSLGRIDAANQVLKEAAEISNVGSAASLERVGASNDQSTLVFKDDYGAARFPDNEGVRNLTKAQARDANQREAASFWGEPVKRDNAVAAHTLTTQGLKLSSRKVANLGAMLVSGAVAKKDEPALLTADGAGAFKLASKSHKGPETGTRAAALGGALVPGVGNVIGAMSSGPAHNRGARVAAAGVGGGVGGEAGRRAGPAIAAYTGRAGPHGVPRQVIGQIVGAALGAAAGGGAGNAAANAMTKKAALKLAKDKSEGGGLGAGIGGGLGGPVGAALGAGLTGSAHDRGRRAGGAALGSILGATAGVGAGMATGNLLAMQALARLGSGGGAVLGNHLARKEAVLKLAKKKSEGGGAGAGIGGALAGPLGAALGAGVSGSEHDRRSRALGAGLGALVGSVAGVGGGLALRSPAAMHALARLGAGAGGAYGNHLGRKEAGLGGMKVSGIGDFAGWVGRGAARVGGKVLGKADEGLHHLRMGKMGPQRQSLFARGQQGLVGLSEGAQKGLGYGVMGAGALGAAGTGYAMTR